MFGTSPKWTHSIAMRQIRMPEVKKRGWIAVTGDGRILTKKHERKVWQAVKLTLFIFYKKYTNQGLWDQVAFLARVWPQIEERARNANEGEAFHVTRRARVERTS